eukprot:m.155645 g.155645  ORF g.155645 m.155645 type:complete len:288 (-) comp17936_c1_seq26:828-1691(-)
MKVSLQHAHNGQYPYSPHAHTCMHACSFGCTQRGAGIPCKHPEVCEYPGAFHAGLVIIVLVYMILTSYRSIRDFFAPEIFGTLYHREPTPADYLLADWPGGILCVFLLGAMVVVRDNRSAVLLMQGIMFAGVCIIGGATLLLLGGFVSPEVWASVSYTGVQMGYIPTGSFLYDRLLAATKTEGTSTFLVFMSDGLAYLVVVGTLFAKALTGLGKSDSAGPVYVQLSVGVSAVLATLIACSWRWLAHTIPPASPTQTPPPTHAIRLEDLNLNRGNDDDGVAEDGEHDL